MRINVVRVFAWLMFALACFLLLYRVTLDSDLLYFEYLFRDLVTGGRWMDWKLPPAPGFFPDLLLYGLGFMLLEGAGWHMYFAAVGQAVLCIAAALWVMREIHPGVSVDAKAFVVSFSALVIISSSTSRAWLFLNSNNVHIAATLFGLLATAASFAYLRRGRNLMPICVAVFCSLAIPSTALFIITFIAPAVAALLLTAVTLRALRSKAIVLLLSIAVGSLFGKLARSLFIFNDAISTRVPRTLASIRVSFTLLGDATRNLFNQPVTGQLATALVTLCCLCICVYSLRLLAKMKSAQHQQKTAFEVIGSAQTIVQKAAWLAYAIVFFFLALVSVIAGSVLSGAFADPFAYRYFTFALALAVMITALIIDGKMKFPALALSLGALLAGTTYYREVQQASDQSIASIGRQGILDAAGNPQPVADCLKDIINQGTPLNAGVTNYWWARSVGFRSNLELLPVDPHLRFSFWIATKGPLANAAHYGRKYNFILLSTGKLGFDFSPESVAPNAPPGEQKFLCKNVDAQVWYYAGDQLDQLLRQRSL